MPKQKNAIKQLKNNRKGFTSILPAIIFAVAAMIVLSIFLYSVYEDMKSKTALQSCKSSIATHSFVVSGTSREFFTDIKCPTSEITIKNSKKAKEIIAEDMHRCWYIWGKGKGQYFKDDGSFCQICSIYQFTDKKRTVTGFMEYLRTQPIKVTYPDDVQGISYQDYFQGYSTPNSAARVDNNQIKTLTEMDVLNTSQKYATIFVYASGKKAIDKVLEGGGRTTLGAAGVGAVILGTAGGVYGVTAIGAAVGATAASVAAVAAGTATTVAVANIWNPIGWIVGGALLIGAGLYALDKAVNPTDPEWVSFLVFKPYNIEELRSIGCEKMEVNQMSNAGTP